MLWPNQTPVGREWHCCGHEGSTCGLPVGVLLRSATTSPRRLAVPDPCTFACNNTTRPNVARLRNHSCARIPRRCRHDLTDAGEWTEAVHRIGAGDLPPCPSLSSGDHPAGPPRRLCSRFPRPIRFRLPNYSPLFWPACLTNICTARAVAVVGG